MKKRLMKKRNMVHEGLTIVLTAKHINRKRLRERTAETMTRRVFMRLIESHMEQICATALKDLPLSEDEKRIAVRINARRVRVSIE